MAGLKEYKLLKSQARVEALACRLCLGTAKAQIRLLTIVRRALLIQRIFYVGRHGDLDFLNYSEVAELIADMIARKDLLPLSLGVFGSWGVGKSSILRLVANE